jgi:tetratricopeptide (TPR) repeat protein
MNESAHVRATLDEIRSSNRPQVEKAEALVELAFDLQKKPRNPQDLYDALALYDEAIVQAEALPLARARALAGRGAALRRMPGTDTAHLEQAKEALTDALKILAEAGDAEEAAEGEMTLGLVFQALAGAGKAPLEKAVQCYHRALRTFRRETHPREFAVIHNNLATAYLSMKLSPEKDVMREALAVQSFQEALKVVSLIDDPSEYAMLQNNLGNALQATRGNHPYENLQRAIEAYDEALKVRTPYDTPLEYANTISNKANALMNLPDDPNRPDAGNPENLRGAVKLLSEAGQLFEQHGVLDRAQTVEALRDSLLAEATSTQEVS